jgi:CubicO group peptidase (beta-lactamase class C family)
VGAQLGVANIRAGTPVTRDTLFMLASVSKTVIATAVLQAVEGGLFELDADVNTSCRSRCGTPGTPISRSRFDSC